MATRGRRTRAAAQKATAWREVRDAARRPKVTQVAADAIGFGKTPCLRVVEQHSLGGLSGRVTAPRTGVAWAQEFRPRPHGPPTTQDGGAALAKGVDAVHPERPPQGQTAIGAQDDPFPGAGRGRGAAAQAWRRAERTRDADAAAGAAWGDVEPAWRLFTPPGTWTTRAPAAAVIAAAWPRWSEPAWAKVRRGWARPQVLAFLAAAAAGGAARPLSAEVRDTAVRVAGWRRPPEAWRGEDAQAAAARGVLLVAGIVRSLSGEAGSQAVGRVRGVRAGVWRASSRVEGLNSVARRPQGCHGQRTPGWLDRKRLSGNGRELRTGRRRGKTPEELQGLALATGGGWELRKRSPQQLRDQLGLPKPPAQERSAPQVAA